MNALLVVVLLIATSGHVRFDPDAPIYAVQSGQYPAAVAEVACERPYSGADPCPERQWVVRGPQPERLARDSVQSRFTREGDLVVVGHELAHVFDGMDDGRMDGSPGHPWDAALADREYPLTATGQRLVYNQHCRSNLAEWYACEVTRTGALR